MSVSARARGHHPPPRPLPIYITSGLEGPEIYGEDDEALPAVIPPTDLRHLIARTRPPDDAGQGVDKAKQWKSEHRKSAHPPRDHEPHKHKSPRRRSNKPDDVQLATAPHQAEGGNGQQVASSEDKAEAASAADHSKVHTWTELATDTVMAATATPSPQYTALAQLRLSSQLKALLPEHVVRLIPEPVSTSHPWAGVVLPGVAMTCTGIHLRLLQRTAEELLHVDGTAL